MLAADVVADSLTVWAVGALMAGGLAVLGFLVRNAFDGVTKGLDSLSGKLDSLKADLARGDGDRRVLEARVVVLERDVSELRRAMHEMSEGRP
jgi:hypothetical protein